MWRSFNIMRISNRKHKRNFKINSKLFEKLKLDYKKELSIKMSGKNNPMYGVESPFKR